MISRDRDVVFRAAVYRMPEDRVPAATGWASEREGDGDINMVACVENTETSAIGRALANLGFTASRKRPSREEMLKADRARRTPLQVAERRSAEGYGATRPVPLTTAGDALTTPSASKEGESCKALSQAAEAADDLREILKDADALGFPAERSAPIRLLLDNGSLDEAAITRLDSTIRSWLSEREKNGPM